MTKYVQMYRIIKKCITISNKISKKHTYEKHKKKLISLNHMKAQKKPITLNHQPQLPCQRWHGKPPHREKSSSCSNLAVTFTRKSSNPFLEFQEKCIFFQLLENHFLIKDKLEHSGRERDGIRF